MKKPLIALLALAALTASSCVAKKTTKSTSNDSNQSADNGGSQDQGGSTQGGGSQDQGGGSTQGGGSQDQGGGTQGGDTQQQKSGTMNLLGTSFTKDAGLPDAGGTSIDGSDAATNLEKFVAYAKKSYGDSNVSSIQATKVFTQKTGLNEGDDELVRLCLGTGKANGKLVFTSPNEIKTVKLQVVRYAKWVSYNSVLNKDAYASFSINGEKHNLIHEDATKIASEEVVYTPTTAVKTFTLQNEDNESEEALVAGRILIESIYIEWK